MARVRPLGGRGEPLGSGCRVEFGVSGRSGLGFRVQG